jgi:hypothetical protein
MIYVKTGSSDLNVTIIFYSSVLYRVVLTTKAKILSILSGSKDICNCKSNVVFQSSDFVG